LLLTPQRSQQQGQGQQQSLLGVLGSACAFELAVGLNGRVWVHAADVATTVRGAVCVWVCAQRWALCAKEH
jgi:exosome complex RNA-binding protein Rrp4